MGRRTRPLIATPRSPERSAEIAKGDLGPKSAHVSAGDRSPASVRATNPRKSGAIPVDLWKVASGADQVAGEPGFEPGLTEAEFVKQHSHSYSSQK